MRLSIIQLIIGLAVLMAGIYLTSFLTTAWVITGTLMAVIGGGLTGVNTYFLASEKTS